MPDYTLTPEKKKLIDDMSQYEMARIWRFGDTTNNNFTQGETGDYFKEVFFNQKGGFTPEISKSLGW